MMKGRPSIKGELVIVHFFCIFWTITGCLVTEEKLISIRVDLLCWIRTKRAWDLYNPLGMTFLFFVVLFAEVASSGQNRPNAGKSWDSWSAFYSTGSYKPPVNGITRYEMKTLSVRERIEIKLLGRQRLFKRNSYQIRSNEYSKGNFFLDCVPRVDMRWLFPSDLGEGLSRPTATGSNNRKCMTVVSYIFSVLLSS